jgi:hypothetical protein
LLNALEVFRNKYIFNEQIVNVIGYLNIELSNIKETVLLNSVSITSSEVKIKTFINPELN